jgi:hypothetical protein
MLHSDQGTPAEGLDDETSVSNVTDGDLWKKNY